MVKLAHAEVSFDQDYEDSLENAKAALGHVDHIIIVQDGSFTEEMKRSFMELSHPDTAVHIVYKAWDDNFPAYRNASLEAAKQLGCDWVAISDADEHYSLKTWQDLKNVIIPDAESNGIDMLGLICKDAFTVIDWLPFDELDKLKELPGGDARESTWHKNLIFKLYPDVDYSGSGGTEGIGGALKTTFRCECGSEEIDYIGNKTKKCAVCGNGNGKEMKIVSTQELKLHEVWGSKSHPWNSANLPLPYHYVHRKSTYRIFRNSARNLVMTGGGDSVGKLNPMWLTLRQIMDNLGIGDWPAFEQYVKGKDDIEPFRNWIRKALVFSATDYGTEVRETAKYLIFNYRFLLDDPEIKHGLDNPPKPDEQTEAEIFVRKMYYKVLQRHPDRKGLDNYTKQITEGKLKKEKLEEILRDSDEYKQKFGEKITWPGGIVAQITVTPEIIVQVLTASTMYNSVVKPRLDIGKFIIERLASTEEERKQLIADYYRDNESLVRAIKGLGLEEGTGRIEVN